VGNRNTKDYRSEEEKFLVCMGVAVENYISANPLLIAKRISSAVVEMPSVSIILYLWDSTVLGEISRLLAIAFADFPSMRNRIISR
jgi:hypothetical protein